MDYLRTIDADGLDPKDYPMPRLNVGSAEAQAEAELKFTEMLLKYARHAMTGRVHFSCVSPNIDYKLAFDADDVLKKIAASNDLSATLETFNPPQPAYQALKAKLAELRDETAENEPARIGNGPVLRYTRDNKGKETVMADARVPQLRERLGLPAEPNSIYNAALAMAVGKFQKANNIQVTGQLNGPTIEALNPRAAPSVSTPCSPPWSAGAGCRAISARPTSCSTSRTIICASTTTARRSGRPAPWSANRAMRRRC